MLVTQARRGVLDAEKERKKRQGSVKQKRMGFLLLFTESRQSSVSPDVTTSCNDGAFKTLYQSGLSFLYPPPTSQLIDYKCSFACKGQSLRLNNKI